MNDPHVVALIYRVEHDPGVDFKQAVPLIHDDAHFSVRIENGRARFEMKEHFATVEEARQDVDAFVDAWRLAILLQIGPGIFSLAFDTAEVIDRNPMPGLIYGRGDIRLPSVRVSGIGHVSHHRYPEPVPGLAINPEVDFMAHQYELYRRGKHQLGHMAYFCLDVLQKSKGGRADAAARLSISGEVLTTLGRLTSEKGGKEARKAPGATVPYSDAERRWIEDAVKALIRRAAEIAANPAGPYTEITMADLPPLP